MTQTQIKVVDAICGAGKSTWAFNHMKENMDKRWIYVSPYLSEVGGKEECTEGEDTYYAKGRIQTVLPEMGFKYPTSTPSKSKSFLRLIEDGYNVGITHSLFSQMNNEILEVLAQNEYHILIDETLDFISIYNGLTNEDLDLFLNTKILSVDPESKRLIFNIPEYSFGVLKEVKELCDNKCLYMYSQKDELNVDTKTLMIQKINPYIINAFRSCTILTYRWESSLMWAWMKLNDLKYEMYYPDTLRDSDEIKKSLRPLIDVVEIPWTIKKLQVDSRGFPLPRVFSKGWYEKHEDLFPTVKTAIEKALQKKMTKKEDTFWTTFIDYKPFLAGKGYTRSKDVVVNGVKVEDRNPFIPKNMRASNEYANCANCIYTCNVYMNPLLANFLGRNGIAFSQDDYALSELIQFAFRGRIRQGQPMSLLILSERMRNLFIDWLYSS